MKYLIAGIFGWLMGSLMGCDVTIGEPSACDVPTSYTTNPIQPAKPVVCNPSDPNCPVCARKELWRNDIQQLVKLQGASDNYMDIPQELRISNWGGGSCFHASVAQCMRWQGANKLADWWVKEYGGGEYTSRMCSRLDGANIKYAVIQDGGPSGMKFLQKAIDLRLCAAVIIPNGHVQTLVGMDSTHCWVLNNNSVNRIDKYTHSDFRSRWTGGAVAVLIDPVPAIPHL